MKMLAVMLAILSLSKLCIVGSSEKEIWIQDLLREINIDPEEFRKRLNIALIVDALIGLLLSLSILC